MKRKKSVVDQLNRWMLQRKIQKRFFLRMRKLEIRIVKKLTELKIRVGCVVSRGLGGVVATGRPKKKKTFPLPFPRVFFGDTL